jgi:hypothetical protein
MYCEPAMCSDRRLPTQATRLSGCVSPSWRNTRPGCSRPSTEPETPASPLVATQAGLQFTADGAGRRHPKNADASMNQSRDAPSAEGAMCRGGPTRDWARDAKGSK